MGRFSRGVLGFMLGALLASVPYVGIPVQEALATVTNQATETVTGYGNGVSTNFTITFDFRANTWITVSLYDTSTTPSTVTVIPYGSGAGKFTITGGDPGTTVVMGTPPTSTQFLIISRSIPVTQPVVFNAGSIFPYRGMSSQLDAMTLMIQDLGASINQAVGNASIVPGAGASTTYVQQATSGTFYLLGTGSSSTANTTVNNFPALTYSPNTGNLNANAATASALASTPTQCTGTNFAQGIAANGNANCAPVSATPGGASTYIQYNNAGAFGGSSTFTLNASTVTVPGLIDSAISSAGPVKSNSSGQLFQGAVTLNTDTTGTLNSTNGGTGIDTHLSTGVPSVSAGTWSIGTRLGTSLGGTNIDTSGSTGVPSINAGTWSVAPQLATSLGGLGGNFGASSGALSISGGTVSAGTLGYANGGTGVATTPTNGQIDIGNGSGFTRTTLTAGTGMTITNGAGTITLSSTSGGTPTIAAFTLLGNSTVAAASASTMTVSQFDAMDGQFNGTNFLSDPSFETFAGTSTFWTTTNGTSSASTVYTDGIQSLQLSMTSQTGSVSQSITPTQQLSGVNLQATCWVKTSLSTMQVCALSGGTAINCQNVPASNTWQPVTSNFMGPSSGSIGVQVQSSASTTGVANIDQCYLGKAVNTSMVSQTQFIGSAYIANTASCNWGRTSATLGAFGTTAACPGPTVEYNPGPGVIQTTDTDLPQFTVNSLPPGNYEASICGFAAVNSASQDTTLAINDGTTTSGITSNSQATTGGMFCIHGFFNYTSTANHTFALWGAAQTNTISVYTSVGKTNLNFSLVRYPNATDYGFRPDQTPASWSGYHTSGGATWARTNTAYGDPTATGTAVLTEVANRNFGTVTTMTSNGLGITTTPPRQGRYWVCANPSFAVDTQNSFGGVSLTDGTTVIAEVNQRGALANAYATMPACGLYNYSGTGSVTFKLQLNDSSGTIQVGSNSLKARSSVEWSIIELDAPMPAPYLIGPQCEWVVDTYSSHGGSTSGETRIVNFGTTNTKQLGSCVTFNARTTTTGQSWTVQTPGLYCLALNGVGVSGGTGAWGVTINEVTGTTGSTDVTTPVTYAQGLRSLGHSAANSTRTSINWCGNLNINDVIRVHDNNASGFTDTAFNFTITKMNN